MREQGKYLKSRHLLSKKKAEKTGKKTAKKAAQETVSRMLRNNKPIEKIVQYVPGLSKEEIRMLAEEILQSL